MPVVVRAARQVIDVCQELFADRRWNCSSILEAPNYLADLTGGTLTIHWSARDLDNIYPAACVSVQLENN